MLKIDETVLRESRYVAFVTLLLSILMESVFLILHKWDYTVLLGNLLGGGSACLNFFLMGITIQKTLHLDSKDAAVKMKLSHMLRFLMLIIAAVLGAALSCFHLWATLIPLFFPRAAVMLHPFLMKRMNKQ